MSHGAHAPKEPIGWTDKPRVVRAFFRTFYVVCAVLVLAEVVVGRHSEHPHPWEENFAFYAIAGFVSFWFLVLVAKVMRRVLMRPEDYYEPSAEASDDG